MAHGPLPHPPTLPHPHVHLMRFLLASSSLLPSIPPCFLVASSSHRYVFKTIANIFGCFEIYKPHQDSDASISYLLDDQNIMCYTADHEFLRSFALVLMVVYGLGIPLGAFGLLFHQRSAIIYEGAVCCVLCAVCFVLYAVYRMLYAARGALSLTHKRHCLRRLPPLLLTVCDQCTKRRPGNRV